MHIGFCVLVRLPQVLGVVPLPAQLLVSGCVSHSFAAPRVCIRSPQPAAIAELH